MFTFVNSEIREKMNKKKPTVESRGLGEKKDSVLNLITGE
ncbi:hypothetical protein U27_03266 [Candidatus Vecturithrix granuli]|uniref:Uncharacterized protein n=1 Tax=Vecturithrix granuli TaxID=1499967 RepID=A0A081BVE9_VECG1|nr:hypothetical protein U27_03266 [Candidatus Vecturithrix granuli]